MRRVVLVVCTFAVAACGGSSTGTPDAGGLDAAAGDTAAADDAAPAADAAPADGPRVSPTLAEDLPTPLPTGAPNVKVANFNAALIPTIKGAAQRLPLVVEAVKGLDADVLCMEEVWLSYTSQEQVAAQVATTFPYAWWQEERTAAAGNGVLILSKHPLYRGRDLTYTVQDFPATLRRKLLGVDVVTPDAHFHVMCTHIASTYDATGQTQRLAQIAELNTFATAQGYAAGPTFLLGDFNTGPDPIGTCEAETPPCLAADLVSYNKLLETWTDPNADWNQCTWCREAALPMQVGTDNSADSRIDHCMYQAIAPATFKGRSLIFDAEINLTVGTSTIKHLSDHYGIRCEFGP
ncbi:MAG TPA: endonuclease/exonuclease/phosphatase family protein [Polyangia bacterium]|jgi:endonuclease/exonuclease/phosphatase family metal-dependent hydrolase